MVTDTSVVIAALLPTDPGHARARTELRQAPDVIAHVLAKAYAVLTRLPAGLQVEPQAAFALLARLLPGQALVLPRAVAAALPAILAEADVSGGATYDAVVGLTAKHHGRTLLTCDRRAASTYASLGVTYQFL